MAKKRRYKTRLTEELVSLTQKYRPDEIQVALGKIYGEYSGGAKSEAEMDFWEKCSKASLNLASGMNKWAFEMLEDQNAEE